MTLRALMAAAIARLHAAGVDGAARDARALVAAALEIEPARITLEPERTITDQDHRRIDAALARRIGREPVARILGQRLFWGREFAVTPDVLDPRPETETVIAAALDGGPAGRLLDMGTGSGILAVTLLAEWTGARGVASDVSAAALAVAGANAARHGVGARLEMVVSDWFGGIAGQFDLIVSNPPYISDVEMAGLAPEVRFFDPHLALTPGGDGLAAYRAIAAKAGQFLAIGGRLMVEIGAAQGRDVAVILQGAGLEQVYVLQDMDGRDRVVSAKPGR